MNQSTYKILEHHDSDLIRIRSDFSTWAVNRRMFETLGVFAQVRLVVSTQIESLAAISNGHGVYLYLHKNLVDHYDEDQELCFFIIMHELRHLTQSVSIRDWNHLVSLVPLIRSLHEVLPRHILQKSGLSELDGDHDLKHEIFNLAADAAIHEDLAVLFGKKILDRAADFMTALERGDASSSDESSIRVGPVTVDFLEKIARAPLERNQDWLYYAKHLIQSLCTRIRTEPEMARLLVDRQILRRIREGGLGDRDIDYDAMSEVDQILGRARGESKKLIESYLGSISNATVAAEGLHCEETYQARKELSQAVKRVIELVRSAISKGQRQKRQQSRSYARPHSFLRDAPGRHMIVRDDEGAESVLVLDTSGSMWIPELLDQMAMMAYQLTKRELIRKAYCCDVELHSLEGSRSGSVRFKGSGGTVWTKEHHTRIIQEVGSHRKINIYYCTDEEVEGLADAKTDDRVNLVVINIPNIINLYEKAAL